RKLLGLLRENVERQVHARLVFLKSDGHYTLTEIATPDFGFKANLKRSNYGIGKVGAPKPEAVSVNLN
ncbi:MAG: hypothetical protein ACJ72Z_10780, partial [Pyrinomonadaceae bacterium]